MTEPLQFRGHIPALDGLRGIAVLMVLVCHFWDPAESFINLAHPFIGPALSKATSGCRFGVELFFVLSGFLITGILLDSRGNSNYYRAFYMRRLLRIFPLYYVALAAIFLILPKVCNFDLAAQEISSRQFWLWTYLSNGPWSGGAWDNSHIFHLGHFWSLCVEEHFYLVWPLVVYVVPTRRLTAVCSFGLFVCFALRLWQSMPGSPSLLGWSTLTKLDGLFVGALLAMGCRQVAVANQVCHWNRFVMMISSLITVGLLALPRRWQGVWWDVVFELPCVICFGSLVVEALRFTNSVPTRILTQGVLRSFGKYSYGIYVIHCLCRPSFQSLFQHEWLLTNLGSPLVGQLIFYALTISSSYILAFASWHLMEKHFLFLKRYFDYKSTAGTISA